ncbi:MAG: hypothetical protein QOH03_3811, partial [Kribbellaceae bacterium]|nr:hypothetical protein [Kribbellaceae bacterium]
MDRPAISTGPALMIPAGYPRDLPSALLRAARDFGTAGVVEIGPDGRETRLDFPTLLELAARILAGLRANGVRAGDPAVVHCTEPVGFFAAFWACTLGGIRPLLMSPSPEGDTTEEGRERLRKVTDLLGWTVLIGRPSDLPNDLGLPVLDPDALAGHEPTTEFHRPAADDVAVLMMTSGSSTGTPKIIQLTHRGLVEFAAGTPAMLPVRPGQTTLNWLPLDHSGAFLLYHLLPVFTGCTNIHVATDWVLAEPLRWLDLMDQHRVNHSWSPNFGYRLAAAAIAEEPDRHWDLSALRSLVSGGEQITVPVVSEFLRLTNRFGVVPETFVAAWGMTETVTGITFGRPGLTPNVHRVRISQTGVVEWVDQRTNAGKVAVARPGKGRAEAPGVLSLVSVGAPAPGATVRIVGPNGSVLPEGRIGQLQIASARVTPGYLGNPDADRAAFPAGNWPARKWLATGDQGFISGGQVVITGRDSERIILNGQTYYAHELEAVAATAPGAFPGLVAACGVADAALGTERLLIFYALSSESAEGVDEAIRSVVRGRLGLDARVVGVPRRHFPTTPGGKILRPLLKQRWLENSLETAPGPYATPPVASPYGDPIRPGSVPATPRSDYDEDASEQTTELPIVRLAWRRNLQDSIPSPPQRPTLGANRHPAPDTLPGTTDADPDAAASDALAGTTLADAGSTADVADTDALAGSTATDPGATATDELAETPHADSPLDPTSADLRPGSTDPETATDATANTTDADPLAAGTEAHALAATTEAAELAGTTEAAALAGATEADALAGATDTAPATSADLRGGATESDSATDAAAADALAGTARADSASRPDSASQPTSTDLRAEPTGTKSPGTTAGAAALPGITADANASASTTDTVPATAADLPGETTEVDSATNAAAADALAGTSRADSAAEPDPAEPLSGTAGADSATDATAADALAGTARADSAGELDNAALLGGSASSEALADAAGTDSAADVAAADALAGTSGPDALADAAGGDLAAAGPGAEPGGAKSVGESTGAESKADAAGSDVLDGPAVVEPAAESDDAQLPSAQAEAPAGRRRRTTAVDPVAESVDTLADDSDAVVGGNARSASTDSSSASDADPTKPSTSRGAGEAPTSTTSAVSATAEPTAEGAPAASSRPTTADLDQETIQLPVVRVSKDSADAAKISKAQAAGAELADVAEARSGAASPGEFSEVLGEAAGLGKARSDDAKSAKISKVQAGGAGPGDLAEVRADSRQVAGLAEAQGDGADSAELAEARPDDGGSAELPHSQADGVVQTEDDKVPADGGGSAGLSKAQADGGDSAGLAEVQAEDDESIAAAKARGDDSRSAGPTKPQADGVQVAGAAAVVADGGSAEPTGSQAN